MQVRTESSNKPAAILHSAWFKHKITMVSQQILILQIGNAREMGVLTKKKE
jgi:hypothetical protein